MEKILTNPEKKSGKVCCIIGAGCAGLACGSLLKQKGMEVKILEALNRIGGRICEIAGFCEKPIEVGASLIHGKDSEFFKLAEKVGAEFKELKYAKHFVCAYTEGYCFYEGKFDKLEKLWDNVSDPSFKNFWNLYENLIEIGKGEYPDISLKEYLIQNNFSQESMFLADGELGDEYSTDIENLSINGILNLAKNWTSGSPDFIIKNMSMTQVLAKIFGNVLENIIYNTQITEIDYSGNQIILYDNNKQTFLCDFCIIAVPISQIRKIKFVPKWNLEKESSLLKITTDPSGKAFFKLTKEFWEKGTLSILIPGPINIFWPGRKGNDLFLIGFVGGSKCNELSKLYNQSKELFMKSIIEPLEKAMKKEIKSLVIDVLWYNWGEQKFFEGGYSHPQVGEGSARRIIQEPIQNRIYFAGEAFAEFNRHTVHGAVDSGFLAAQQILNSL